MTTTIDTTDTTTTTTTTAIVPAATEPKAPAKLTLKKAPTTTKAPKAPKALKAPKTTVAALTLREIVVDECKCKLSSDAMKIVRRNLRAMKIEGHDHKAKWTLSRDHKRFNDVCALIKRVAAKA